MRQLVRRLRRRPLVVVCGSVNLLILLLAVAGPFLVPYAPTRQALGDALLPPPVLLRGGSWSYPLGTDALGRDIATQLVYSARVSIFVATLAVLGSLTLGTAVGLLSGFYGRGVDTLLMGLAEIHLAFPFILLALMFVSALGTGVLSVIVVLVLSAWPTFARMARGEAVSLREREFIVASRALGNRDGRIILRHLLPNVSNSMLVLAALMFGRMILLESGLSYLGLGVPPPTPTWGGMIFAGQSYLAVAWWISTLPGLLLTTTVVAVNLFGDAIRDLYAPAAAGE